MSKRDGHELQDKYAANAVSFNEVKPLTFNKDTGDLEGFSSVDR